jgi:hypothetical protein
VAESGAGTPDFAGQHREGARPASGIKVKEGMDMRTDNCNVTLDLNTENDAYDGLEYVDDVSITAQVRMALLFNRSTSRLKTKISTRDGVVTVDGKVKDDAAMDLVSRCVGRVKGVKSVVNRLNVEQPADEWA